ncbi:MAG TPA: RHS repeat-associated core domain-containing protein, partial [Pyrinomonadaceae bacterium]
TTNYEYNARDQLTKITQQNDRVRTFNYDGLGRLLNRITPEQGQTNYTYFDDGLPQTITDARGAKATFTYNPRHLVTGIAYDTTQAPGVSQTSAVTFGYDAAGNRTSMGDAFGTMTYAYDQLSRMTSETRNITNVGSFTLTYGYNFSGQLTSFTNPWGAQVGYSYDQAGRLTDVTGSGYAGVSIYASGLTYRAFGGIKGMSYGNGRNLSVTYDNRLRPTRWSFGATQDYQYFYDYLNEHTGRVTYAQNMNDGHLDRSYEYDQVGRLAITHTGAEARAHAYSGQWGTMDGPYSLGFDYDVWGNMTHRYGWGGEVQGGSAGQASDLYYNYGSTNRRTDFTYDAAGNLTFDGGQNFEYDATGQQTKAYYTGYTLNQGYDGNGLRVSKSENNAPPTYYLRSSVLGGQVVAEVNRFSVAWGWNRGYVYSGAGLMAVQYGNAVSWVHEDPITKSKRITNSSGTVISSIELDPWGADAGSAWSSNAAFQPRKFTTYDRDGNGSDEAMFRRHNRWHSRFDQPDPSGRSYKVGDPQSFNRYAYVQNDPVTLVDPLGLDGSDPLGPPPPVPTLAPPAGPLSTITTNTWAPYWIRGSSGDGTEWHTLAVIDRGDLNSGIAGTIELVPQNTAPPTDCQLFVASVAGIASSNSDPDSFMDEMARTFTAANSSSTDEMRSTANQPVPPGRQTFGPANGPNGGFKAQFRDNSNQVRHFVGGLIAGYRLGYGPALLFMNSREEPNTNGVNNADIALNAVSTALGANHVVPPRATINPFGLPVNRGFHNLADAIRREICDP